MLSQNGLAKADLLVMHNSRLTPAAATPAQVSRPPKCTLHRGGVRFIWRYRSHPPPVRKDRTMTDAPKLGFTPFARLGGVLVVFCGENLKFGTATQRALAPVGDLVRRAAAADRFTGKNGATLDIVAPAGLKLPRLVVVGTGKDSDLKRKDVVKLGGIAMGKVPAVAAEATIFAEFASGALKGDQIADLVLGARLRAYTFDRYKTKRKDDDR